MSIKTSVNKKARSRGSDSADESLRGKNRELQKEIRQLQQYIRQLEKQLLLRQNKTEKEQIKKQKDDVCPKCGKGSTKTIDFPIRDGAVLLVTTCNLCDYEDRIKK